MIRALSTVSLLLAAPLAPGQSSVAHVSSAPLPDGRAADAAWAGDQDGDGQADLLIASHEVGRPFARSLRGHLGRGEGQARHLPSEPDFQLELTRDVVAFALADVHPDPGREVLLFTARGVFAWRPGGPERERVVHLLSGDFLWQLPHPEAVFAWSAGVVDLDGDGLDDVLLPEPGGYRLAVQRRDREAGASFELQSLLRVPLDPDGGLDPDAEGGRGTERGAVRVRLGEGEDDGSSEKLLAVSEAVPTPRLLDWDGDGDRDLLAQSPQRLHVWLQEPGGRFEADPSRSLTVPVPGDWSRRLDASFSAHAEELSGDGRADYLVFAGDRRTDSVRTQSLLFLQNAASEPSSLFGEEGRPGQVLVLAGFVVRPQLADVNGDGRIDLAVSVVRPDLIDQLRTVASGRLEARMYVYLNQGGRFSKRPDLDHAFRYPPSLGLFTGQFLADVTGDGVRELLLRDELGRIRLLYVRPDREGLQVLDRPLWEYSIEEGARVVLPPEGGLGEDRILIIERGRVLLVELVR